MYSRSSGLTTVKTKSAPSRADALEDGARDLLRAHPRVQADLRARLGKLQERRAHDLLGGLAGRIADDVDETGGHAAASYPIRREIREPFRWLRRASGRDSVIGTDLC